MTTAYIAVESGTLRGKLYFAEQKTMFETSNDNLSKKNGKFQIVSSFFNDKISFEVKQGFCRVRCNMLLQPIIGG